MKKLGNELTLILLMTDGNDYTAQDLCKQLDCTRRNLYYYLQFLRDYGFEVLKKGDYYRLSLQSPFFERLRIALNFTGKEAATIYELAHASETKKALLQSIQKKLARAYDLRLYTDSRYKRKQIQHLEDLSTAIQNHKVVCLHHYSSPHSRTYKDRKVEPFALLNNNQEVRCYEYESKRNKTFKLSRIGRVEILEETWTCEAEHRPFFTDIFGFCAEESHSISFTMGQLAYHLLTEEYPQSLPFITPIDDYHWRLQTLVASYTGVGRFVIGLYDDIEVEGDEDFEAYLHTRIQKLLQHKAL